MITRMLAGVGPAGRPVFLKMVYHGPKAMEELVRFDPHLVVGILGGSAGTTRDAFQLLHDAQKYGAKVALFGRKINNAENQLAFVHFLRLIVEGQVGPVDAVKAYHAVLGRLGLRPHRSLDDDLKITDQSMSYAGRQLRPSASTAAGAEPNRRRAAASPPRTAGLPAIGPIRSRCRRLRSPGRNPACPCQSQASRHGAGPDRADARTERRPLVTESYTVSRYRQATSDGRHASNGRPDFARMSPAERLAYHRQRLGLGR